MSHTYLTTEQLSQRIHYDPRTIRKARKPMPVTRSTMKILPWRPVSPSPW
jgi:hypothetical protein